MGTFPPALSQLLVRLVAKSPDKRLQHPAELAAALAPLCRGANLSALLSSDGGPAVSCPPSLQPAVPNAVQRSLAWCRRRRFLLAGGILLASLAVAVICLIVPGPRMPKPVAVKSSLLYIRHAKSETLKYTLIERGKPREVELPALRPGDDFKFFAEFSRPSPWYLVWIDTNGLVEIAAKSDGPREIVQYPVRDDRMVGVNPQDPLGVHLLLLVVSDRPADDVVHELLANLRKAGRPDAVLEETPSGSRGAGSEATITTVLRPDYLRQIEINLPPEAQWAQQLYLRTTGPEKP